MMVHFDMKFSALEKLRHLFAFHSYVEMGSAAGVRLVMEQNCLLGFETVIRVRSTVVTTVTR
jgi:hypothetical protein